MTGIIKRLLLPRGFGFIRGDDGLEYFLHARECDVWSGEVLHEGLRVEFEPREVEKKKFRALQVKILL